jgi:hypothetical protein
MIFLKSTLAGLLAVLAAIIVTVIAGPDFRCKVVDAAGGSRDFLRRFLLGVFPRSFKVADYLSSRFSVLSWI